MREWLTQAARKETYEAFRKAVLYGIGEEAARFFADDAPQKYSFEKRDGQLEMAWDILDALMENRHIAVEAGVGIGKSFAYLLPLLFYSESMDRPVVVATSTIALQEQLLADVERLQGLLGIRREVILAKGQTHYLCQARMEEYLRNPESPLRGQLLDAVRQDCEERKSFPFPIPDEVWKQINISGYGKRECENCRYPCPYAQIRERLKKTRGVIVCNQDFLTAHLIRRKRRQEGLISSLVDVVVVDEAHNLESKVRSALTERLSYDTLYRTLEAISEELAKTELSAIQPLIDDTQKAAFNFFQCLYGQIREQNSHMEQEAGYADRFFFDADPLSLSLLYELAKNINRLSRRVSLLTCNYRRGQIPRTAETLEDMGCMLENLLVHLQQKLVWIKRTEAGAELRCCPADIHTAVQELYFNGRMRTILTSATLTNTASGTLEERYAYFVRNTGFPAGAGGVLAEPKPSPFPYQQHAMIYYGSDLPHPTKKREAFLRKGTKRLIEILNISHGKALVLFTAKEDMEEVYRRLQKKRLPYKILKQSVGASQEEIRREFEADTDSVLLGTGAYWEGISIEGKSLSSVIIFRLPFSTPDPITCYKSSLTEDPLMEVQIPEMVIKLKQGIGRLIRNFTDTGIVSIIDPRLRDHPPARYHDTVWDALPVQNCTTNLRELRKFYQSLQNQQKTEQRAGGPEKKINREL